MTSRKAHWVQDCPADEASELLLRVTQRNFSHTPKGSHYEIAESKSGNPDMKGLWYIDEPCEPGGHRGRK